MQGKHLLANSSSRGKINKKRIELENMVGGILITLHYSLKANYLKHTFNTNYLNVINKIYRI